MDTRLFSAVSASPRSLSSLSLSESSDIGTPETARSLLFDDGPSFEDTSFTGPHVLVVGGLGYIGSHVCLELLKEGYNVIVIDDLSNSYRTVLDRIEKLAAEHCKTVNKHLPSLHFHEIDYRSPAMRSVLRQYENPTFTLEQSPRQSKIAGVIHFAAFKSVEESIKKPLAYYKNNVAGLIDFLEILSEFNIYNFVFSSSATVYGRLASQGTPLHEESMTAVDGVHGLTSPYGRSKYFCEAILDDVARSDPRWAITALRYFNPVGCHESGLLGEDPRQKPTNLFPCITGQFLRYLEQTGIQLMEPPFEISYTLWTWPEVMSPLSLRQRKEELELLSVRTTLEPEPDTLFSKFYTASKKRPLAAFLCEKSAEELGM
ncbi:hypothetical protein H2199_002502 [Coniosporium tulheliwenetii]|uniref:Uncharacterized protein n=1 Tax=Coniosporium tulheliwenetii TaxID=3383036 RepID=A0ACC2ZGM0_9PEZI|nr:hypothetical protein H2199_002502 [Cladosporium sp. JES 115]